MEQETKQLPFPVITKIVALWLIISPIILAIAFFFFTFGLIFLWFFITDPLRFIREFPFLFCNTFIMVLLIFNGLFLLKRKKTAWWFIETILFIGILISIKSIFKILIIFVPPFILLLLDRKNFFKIAS
jgi:hypothetical protein